MLKMGLRKILWTVWVDLCDSGWGPVVGSCSHDNERSGSIRSTDFLIS
jgi:hypothetical protein